MYGSDIYANKSRLFQLDNEFPFPLDALKKIKEEPPISLAHLVLVYSNRGKNVQVLSTQINLKNAFFWIINPKLFRPSAMPGIEKILSQWWGKRNGK